MQQPDHGIFINNQLLLHETEQAVSVTKQPPPLFPEIPADKVMADNYPVKQPLFAHDYSVKQFDSNSYSVKQPDNNYSVKHPYQGNYLLSCTDPDMDLLLANVGYNVKASDLPQVAQRLEHLESVVSGAPHHHDVTQLFSESVHYNPSDMASWIECMIEELTPICADQSLPQRLFSLAEADAGINYNSYYNHNHYNDIMEEQGAAAAAMDPNLDHHDSTGSHSGGVKLNVTHCLQSSADSFSSISELIKDSIDDDDDDGLDNDDEQAASPVIYNGGGTAEGQKYREGEAAIGPLDEGFQRYRAVDNDQTSSSSSFYQRFHDESNMDTSMFADAFQQGSVPNDNVLLQDRQRESPQGARAAATTSNGVSQSQSHDVNFVASASPHSSYGSPPYPAQQQMPHHHHDHHIPSELKEKDHVDVVANQSSTMSSTTSQPDDGQSRHGKANDNEQYADVNAEGSAQEAGIRLVHLLMSCAEAVQNHELTGALDMAREVKGLASYHNGAMGKVANHFVEALARRICGGGSGNVDDAGALLTQTDAFSELLYFHFYETCPYLKFAHFTANQAILEAFEGHKFVHVIDFNLMQGLQWPALIQALALRPGGPPHLRITGIGLPQPDNRDVLQEIGLNLARLAESVNVEFSFRGVIATKLNDVKPRMLEVKEGEAIAVNSILQLHRLLNGQTSSASVPAPIDQVLESVKTLKPKIVTIVEQEASHNSPLFLDRFVQALHYYCTMFDSLEACCLPPHCADFRTYAEMYLGREIVNIVACEGVSRIERHEPLMQWRQRMMSAGFRSLHLGSNAFKQASMLLTLFSGEGYTVDETSGCLTLGWHSRPLIAASAWQCG